jgi:hypothetical protein
MKRIVNFMFHLACVLALSRLCSAENLKIHGVVMDGLTRAFVSGARVSLSGQRATKDAVTDVEGFFLLPLREGIKPGDVIRIRVDKVGYEAYDREEAVSPERTLEILLQPTARSVTPRKSVPKASPPQATVRTNLSLQHR